MEYGISRGRGRMMLEAGVGANKQVPAKISEHVRSHHGALRKVRVKKKLRLEEGGGQTRQRQNISMVLVR